MSMSRLGIAVLACVLSLVACDNASKKPQIKDRTSSGSGRGVTSEALLNIRKSSVVESDECKRYLDMKALVNTLKLNTGAKSLAQQTLLRLHTSDVALLAEGADFNDEKLLGDEALSNAFFLTQKPELLNYKVAQVNDILDATPALKINEQTDCTSLSIGGDKYNVISKSERVLEVQQDSGGRQVYVYQLTDSGLSITHYIGMTATGLCGKNQSFVSKIVQVLTFDEAAMDTSVISERYARLLNKAQVATAEVVSQIGASKTKSGSQRARNSIAVEDYALDFSLEMLHSKKLSVDSACKITGMDEPQSEEEAAEEQAKKEEPLKQNEEPKVQDPTERVQ